MASKLTDKDRGFAALMAAPAAFGGNELQVGIFDEEQSKIGFTHEFGTDPAKTPYIPPRPWLRGTADANKKGIGKRSEKIAIAVIEGRSPTRDLNAMGQWLVRRMRKFIFTQGPSVWPPLKEATIKAKGNDAMLVDTGAMVSSIEYRVEKKRS